MEQNSYNTIEGCPRNNPKPSILSSSSPIAALQSSEKSTPQSENADICISQKPQVKVIAEKFTKYKKNAIEVRKLNEKVVCLEYDVFDSENIKTPLKKMRAYFSIKPKFKNADEGTYNTNLPCRPRV